MFDYKIIYLNFLIFI